jgi:hypothetical protein
MTTPFVSLRLIFSATLCALLLTGVSVAMAQNGTKGKRDREREEPAPRLPDDKRLLSLHLDFVRKAEKLAGEYENGKDWGKARDVYQEILKLVPQYPPAQAKLADMIRRESEAEHIVFSVKADEGWQDTHVVLIPGKPVSLQVSGTWTFNLKVETNGEGLAIPKELRDFNPGCLIGMIVDGRTPMTGNKDDEENAVKPFIVGAGKQLMPERGGRLYLRMYDTVPADNVGALKVDIRGTFGEAK